MRAGVQAIDEELAECARRGSGLAFGALVERHGDRVYWIARNLCDTAAEAEEVTRQTFLSAYQGIALRDPSSGFQAWLSRIAVETALALRQARPRPAGSLESLLPRFDEAGHLIAPPSEWPELDRVEVTGVLREALGCMEDGVRAAFVLCDLAELPAEEAAGILQTSTAVIQQRVHRARLMLRGFLDRLWIRTAN